MPFIPHTEDDVSDMLATLGISSVESLFDEIPEDIARADLSGVRSGLSEMAMTRELAERAQRDVAGPCFIGAGCYDHYIPAAVWDLASRGEFLTAYTPYQAEASQGTLQLLYEFQTMMASLTQMDVANASVYDGGSALGEAILMAVRSHRRSKSQKVVVAGAVNPRYLQAASTLVRSQGIELEATPQTKGVLDPVAFEDESEVVAVVVQQPNFFGNLEPVDEIAAWAKKRNARLIASVNPMTLAVLKPPGDWDEDGADIVCGDGQPFGIPMASGGPSFGFLCTKMAYVRQLPGRIVGGTVDREGKPGYTLTLQAREQHIRRARATSNICTNQGLLVTAATIYMSLMGPQGLRNTAFQCHQNTHDLVARLSRIDGVEPTFNSPYFHECALDVGQSAQAMVKQLAAEHGVVAGPALNAVDPELKHSLLVCATEQRTDADMECFVQALRDVKASS